MDTATFFLAGVSGIVRKDQRAAVSYQFLPVEL
jgi:hypothetical protein